MCCLVLLYMLDLPQRAPVYQSWSSKESGKSYKSILAVEVHTATRSWLCNVVTRDSMEIYFVVVSVSLDESSQHLVFAGLLGTSSRFHYVINY